MCHQRKVFLGSICTTLRCTPDDFWSIYENEKVATDALSNNTLTNVIGNNHEKLRAAERRYRIDDLLSGMIIHAPHPLGQRYVAVSIHIAHKKGEDVVIDLAKAWMEQLFLPMLAMSKVTKTEPSSSETPESEVLNFRDKLAIREEHYCAMSRRFDAYRTEALFQHGRQAEIPEGCYFDNIKAVHIIPFSFNDFTEKKIGLEIRDAAYTCDMFQSWTQIDLHALAGPNIDSPANGIFLASLEHRIFRQFKVYLDKDAYPNSPNKYRARAVRLGIVMSTGKDEADVEFRSLTQSGFDPPNPTFIRAHAGFAKVLNLCGAAQYLESVERDADKRGFLRENGETDVALLLTMKLAIARRTVVP